MKVRRIALVGLALMALTACGNSADDSGRIVKLNRPDGGTVECAVISGGTRMSGIDCNWEGQ